MYGREHPSAFGPAHPWLDPLVPQDFLNPRPDQEIAFVGPLGPRPEDFPFTEQGRRDFYDAVRAAAQQQTMMQQQAMHHQMAAQRAYEAEQRARRVTDHLLLLRR